MNEPDGTGACPTTVGIYVSMSDVRRSARSTMPRFKPDPSRGAIADLIADVFAGSRSWNHTIVTGAAL